MDEEPHTVATEIKILVFDNDKWSLSINGEEVKHLIGFSVKGNWLTGVAPYDLMFDPKGTLGT